jgi:uncharacterized LabA/DUF88 family protein
LLRIISPSTLFIDGENFIYKLETVIKEHKLDRNKVDLTAIQFDTLFTTSLKDFKVSKKIFYAAKLHVYPETKKQSEKLIKFQRKLRNTLVKQGFKFIIAGNVRGQKVGNKTVFREKGVDVRIAVDLVSQACDKKIKTAILCSSDSDLQPAVKELRKRNVKVVYLGFKINPNRGLIATTDKTILFNDSEIIEAVGIKRDSLKK